MDRNTIVRWAIIAIAVALFMKFGPPIFGGKKDASQADKLPAESYVSAPGFMPDPIDPNDGTAITGGGANGPEGTNAAVANAPTQTCKIKGNRFDAEMTSHGAGLTHFYLRDAVYAGGTNGFDLSTTPDIERWHSLRTLFRGGQGGEKAADTASDQVKYDRFDWKLDRMPEDAGCTFTYEDDSVRIVKSVAAGARPFEMNVETTLTNLSDAPKRHRFSIEAFAFHTNAEVKGHLGRVSPFQTELVCAREKDVTRKAKDDFKEGWFSEPIVDRFVAVSNYYFAQALVPTGGPEKPECRTLAENWFSAGQAHDADDAADVYHGQLLYPQREVAPKASVTYKQIAFFGPKEREVLSHAAGGKAELSSLINLGFFSAVAKVLVGALVFFHDHVTFGSWGVAIIALTICLRLLLFPLTWKSIKTTVGMRRFKPDIDQINKKFEGDAQARQMATMELYRKHGINPLGGCLPQLVQMPVWFAMYTTLQTAVEMYHTKFLWFTDLSAPDRFYVLPLVLGAFMIVQQRIMPQQGMDPLQQKMMMYLLPLVFTVMMLFLPAALGIYMLTNSALGIVQQLLVEKIAPRNGASGPGGAAKGEIVVKQGGDRDDQADQAGAKSPAFGKGKARV